jgi:LacI family transcriptional regulator
MNVSTDHLPIADLTDAADRAESGAGVVTLEMVAREAGVSPSTVSRILNGSAAVSEAKKSAVDDAIRKLRFRPNPVARGLAGGRTLSVGVLTQTISSPFYGEALHGIEDSLEQAGYIPLFVSGHWQEAGERKALEALLSRRVDGLIVLAGRLASRDLETYARSVPMVVVGRGLSGSGLFSLEFDNRAGGLLATRHLIECGHTRIAFIAGDAAHQDAAHQDALQRQAGYCEALESAGIAFDPALVMPGDFTEAGGLLAVNRLLESRTAFTGIFAANDQTAIGAALGLHRKNVRIPDDVSLVGFDDLAPARYAIPPLTTVRQSVYEMGCQAAKAMLDLLRGVSPTVTLPPPQLVPRESTRRVIR